MGNQSNTVRRLSLQNRLIVIASIARLLCLEGVGTAHDLHWFSIAEDWLQAIGVRVADWWTVKSDEQRVA